MAHKRLRGVASIMIAGLFAMGMPSSGLAEDLTCSAHVDRTTAHVASRSP